MVLLGSQLYSWSVELWLLYAVYAVHKYNSSEKRVKYSIIPVSKNFPELQSMADRSFGLLYSKYFPKSKEKYYAVYKY